MGDPAQLPFRVTGYAGLDRLLNGWLGMGSFIVQPLMLCWIPISVALFAYFPARRAIIISFVVAWLFLPVTQVPLPLLPNLGKETAASYGALLGVFLFDSQRLISFRPAWIDIPAIVWFVCPAISSVTNGLGLYDGVVSLIYQCSTWGIPYLLGRLYFSDLKGLRELAVGMFVGGLSYVLPCLYEVRLSPQLHIQLYGFFPHDSFAQSKRLGGWRPTVFMEHGLMVGAWMMASALSGTWLWHSSTLKKIWIVPVSLLSPILLLTFALLKSTGAYVLLAFGILVQLTAKFLKTALPLIAVLALIPGYIYFVGIDGSVPTETIVQPIAQFQEHRAASLKFRLDNERILVDHAKSKVLFGWGGWGRSRPTNPDGSRAATQDSLWIIAYGKFGIVGLVSLYSLFLLPVIMFIRRYPVKWWFQPTIAPAAIAAVILTLYTVDCLVNAMFNPVFIIASGSLAGLAVAPIAGLSPARPPSKKGPMGPVPGFDDPSGLGGQLASNGSLALAAAGTTYHFNGHSFKSLQVRPAQLNGSTNGHSSNNTTVGPVNGYVTSKGNSNGNGFHTRNGSRPVINRHHLQSRRSQGRATQIRARRLKR